MTLAAPDPRRWFALAVVGAAFFMTILDVSIVNVALPSIGTHLHFSAENLQWVVTAYALAYGGFLLLGGRAADLLGRRRVFMSGVALFSITRKAPTRNAAATSREIVQPDPQPWSGAFEIA